MERYIVKPEDLKGEIANFPIEVVQRMVDCQVEQGNKADVRVFQLRKLTRFKYGGFDWDKTTEGDSFWLHIICNKTFNLFFEKYLQKKSLYTAIAEAVKSVVNADTSVEIEEKDGTVIIRAIEKKSEDLPIDTPCMVEDHDTTNWRLRYYAGNSRCWQDGLKSSETKYADNWYYIIPFNKFDPTDIEKSLRYNIVK